MPATVLIREVGPRDGLPRACRSRPVLASAAHSLAALDVGGTSVDSAQAGLGGGPFAPGAPGNVVTEDLVCLFECVGVHTSALQADGAAA